MMSRFLLIVIIIAVALAFLLLLILDRVRQKLEAEKEKNKKAAKVIDAVLKNKEAQKENEELKNKINGNPDNNAFNASVELLQKCNEAGCTRNK